MTGAAVVGGVALLRAAVDSLLCAPVDGLPAAELLGVFAEVEMQRNRLAALDHRLIAALGESGAVLESGSTSLPDLVSAVTRCSRGEARARVGRSVDLGPRRAVSGEVLEPIHPVLAGAVAEGMVSESQCDVIVAALGRVGPDAQADAFEVAERFLVEAARVQPPAALARSARWVLSRLDPAGLEPSEKTVERVRSFWLSDGLDADGAVAAKGRLTRKPPQLCGQCSTRCPPRARAPRRVSVTVAAPGSGSTTRCWRLRCGSCAPVRCPSPAVSPRA